MRGAAPSADRKSLQQRGGGRAVHVIIAEHGDALARLQRRGDARDRLVHVLQHRRIGQKVLQLGRQIVGGLGQADARAAPAAAPAPAKSRAAARAPAAHPPLAAASACPRRSARRQRPPAPLLSRLRDRAAVARLDPAHRAGGRAHDHAFGGDEIAVPVHAAQHGAVGDAGGGEHHVARGQFISVYLRLRSLMPHLAARGARHLVAEDQPPCIWPPTQRSAAAASTPSGAPPCADIDVDAGGRDRWSRSRRPHRRR